MIATGVNVGSLEDFQRRRRTAVWCLVSAAAVGTSAIAGALATGNHLILLAALVVLAAPLVASWRMAPVVFGLTFLSLAVEQYQIGAEGGDLTERIPLFTSLSDGFQLSGVYVNPVEVLLAGVLLVVVIRKGPRSGLPRSALGAALAAMVALVAFGAVHGIAAGGDMKMALWEMRPFIYVGTLFVLARRLPVRVETVTAFLWVFVAAVGVRSLEGLVLLPEYLHSTPRPDFLLSHEDSFLFVLFIVMVAALWLFGQRGRLRAVTTAMLPVVLIVNLANNRRTSWLMLGAAMLVLGVMAWVRLPQRRRPLAGLLAALVLGAAIYFPVYWDRNGLLAGPAEAARSAVAPSPRDSLSDIYRQLENANLATSARRSPVIGVGSGVPLTYVVPVVDLTGTDPFIRYIPHNGILYIWWRFGAVGAVVFWSFIGFAMLSACRLLRATDPRLAMFGAFSCCALVAYLVLGDLDMGLWWFRVAVLVGCLLGVLDVAHRVDVAEAAEAANRRARGHAPASTLRADREVAGVRHN
jgi:O-antigen ligase